MWIVGIDENYYPYIEVFENYEDAKKYYDDKVSNSYSLKTIYLAEVKEWKEI